MLATLPKQVLGTYLDCTTSDDAKARQCIISLRSSIVLSLEASDFALAKDKSSKR
jgi:hypothetical protein